KICARALEQLEIERALAIAGDEDADSDDRSDHFTATKAASDNDSDSESDSPVLLQRIPGSTKFTFAFPITSPVPSPPQVPAARPTGLKRGKGHPDAPSPIPSPQKGRLFKRRPDSTVPAPAQPLFAPLPSSFTSSHAVDVFGSVTRRAEGGYVTDSEREGEGGSPRGMGDADEYAWGPEDDALGPPESQLSSSSFDDSQSDGFTFVDPPAADDNTTTVSDIKGLPDLVEVEYSDSDDDMTGLASVDNSEDEAEVDDSDSEDEAASGSADATPAHAGPSRADLKPLAAVAAAKPKITEYWKTETAEEKAVRREKDARMYSERAEQTQLREVQEKRKKVARARVIANERMQRHRDRVRDAKIAEGWIPGMKRKRIHLLEYDETPTSQPADLAELSRPRRQFKEDERKDNKPSGRKQKPKNKKRGAQRTNWQTPFLWSQIDSAARRSSRPWSPRAILADLQKSNIKDFCGLKEQVLGRWIEGSRKSRTSRWRDTILRKVEAGKGNAPGGQTTRCGVLHPFPATRKKINDHLTSLRGAGVALTLLSIRGIMVGHIQNDAPELFQRTMSDGSNFRCSESFARRYLRNTLGWSERRATKAAQKLPANHEKLLEEAFFPRGARYT
ncbi:hypothetical protein C8R44DRAFT_946758, partial [Mycena epipterygia]